MGDDDEDTGIELIPPEMKEKLVSRWIIFYGYFSEFSKGIFSLNPIVMMSIALCPALAVSDSLSKGLTLGLATLFIITFSSLVISIFKKFVPDHLRRISVLVITGTFTTIAYMFIEEYYPFYIGILGIYLPLIALNCMIFARLEVFAMKKGVFRSFLDGLGSGFGFLGVLVLLSSLRELFGTGQILLYGKEIFSTSLFNPAGFFITAPGAFFTLGVLLAFINMTNDKIDDIKEKRRKKPEDKKKEEKKGEEKSS